MKQRFYRSLPEPMKPPVRKGYRMARRAYRGVTPGRSPPLVEDVPGSRRALAARVAGTADRFQQLRDELERGETGEYRSRGLARYERLGDDIAPGGVATAVGADLFALVRALEPDRVVETGVCNGLSTLHILLALDRNGTGRLHSIDYPYRAHEPLDAFRKETFDSYGGAAIPADREPGWIVPDPLRSRWDLTVGRTQRELPRLASGLDTFDLFLHDSEHSFPCMMFELELAWEWLGDGGVVVVDDVGWNDAFERFVETRTPDYGMLRPGVGYLHSSSA